MSSKRPHPLGQIFSATNLYPGATERKHGQLGRLLMIGLNPDQKAEVGFMARMLVICTMPHTDKELSRDDLIERRNGDYVLYVQPGPKRGLPYGMYPRLIMAWMTQEVQRTRSRELKLGRSLTAFMNEIGSEASWGKRGTAATFRDQMERLFSSRVWLEHHSDKNDTVSTINVADRWQLWWQPSNSEQDDLFESTVVLGEELYRDMLKNPIPFDKRVVRALGNSPLAFDLYTWLTYRVSYMKDKTVISYAQLAEQIGSDYSNQDEFARYVRKYLQVIKLAWPQLYYETPRGRLFLYPCHPHVPKLESKSDGKGG